MYSFVYVSRRVHRSITTLLEIYTPSELTAIHQKKLAEGGWLLEPFCSLNRYSHLQLLELTNQTYIQTSTDSDFCDGCKNWGPDASWLGPKILLRIGHSSYKGHKRCMQKIRDNNIGKFTINRHQNSISNFKEGCVL